VTSIAQPTATLSIRLFGSPEILRDGLPLTVARRKSRALLYYLAARRAATPRDHVIDLLWPDLPRPAAQQTLRATLYGIRKSLGAALLADEALALDPACDVDLWQLDDALASPLEDPGPLAHALDRYRGDFLDGFGLPDTPAFDDWAAAVRERYRALVMGGLSDLARAYEERGEYRAALEALDRALALDPLQEDAQREAMRLQYLAGDRVGAIRRYEQLRRRLDDELGVPPMSETQAIYDAIITDSLAPESAREAVREGKRIAPLAASVAAPQHAPPALLPFTGRVAELHAVAALVSTQQLVLVEGEPGIGKTRLVEEFLRGGGALALVGTARELDRSLPYQPIVEALRGLTERPDWPEFRGHLSLPLVWTSEVARLLPELTPAGAPTPPPTADESRLREGVSQLLRSLSRRRPVALFIDDLQWADDATLGLLGYLARQQLPGVGLVAATRPVEPRTSLATLVQALVREGRLGRVQLERLRSEEMLVLARHLGRADGDELAGWLARNSEGNPYILAELARHAQETGALRPDGVFLGSDLYSDVPVVPPTIYTLISSRLARLSDPARRVLDTAVAAGREFSCAVVAQAAALSDDAALDALDELTSAGLVHPINPAPIGPAPEGRGGMPASDLYAFDHTLTMEVAYQQVGEARHRLLHRRLAEALEALYRRRLESVAGLIAMHFVEGGAPERASPYALRAAERAASLAAWTEAIHFYKLALGGVEDGERTSVLKALGEAHLAAGASVQATEALREAEELARAQGDERLVIAIQLSLAQALLAQSRFAEVIAIAQPLTLSDDPDRALHGELLWGTALSLEGSDLAGAAEHLRRAEQRAEACNAVVPNPAQRAHAHFELGSVLAQQGDLAGAVERYRAALGIAATAGDAATPWHILAYNNLAYHLHLLGDPSALAYARSGFTLAQERGAISMQAFLLSTMGEIALAQGDLATAERHFAEGLAIAERLNVPERIAGLGANLGLIARRRGNTAAAIQRLSAALERADALGTRHLAAQIRIWLAPLLPPEAARAMLAEAHAIAASGGRRRLLEQIEALEAV
jgi:DNA-binding SARP family transcriptional activator